METSDNEYNTNQEVSKTHLPFDKHRNRHSGRVMAGLIIIIAGTLLFAREWGVYFPEWLFSWPMILIVIGIYSGAKHNFRNGGWLILIALGAVFLIEQIQPALSFKQYIWPVFIIAIGVIMILRPRRKKNEACWPSWESHARASSRPSGTESEYIDSVSIFGGNKKNIITKDFKGGDIVIFFGGMELNLTQADMTKPAVLDLTAVFGGAKLIVPSNWHIKSELTTVFGQFEDKRIMVKDMPETDKVLILRGTCVFGGIDVKSYQ